MNENNFNVPVEVKKIDNKYQFIFNDFAKETKKRQSLWGG